jgi:hypothetical protein
MLDCLNSICQIWECDAIKTGVSPEGTHMNAIDGKLSKLQAREAALTAQAKQLQERAAHLERVRLNHAKKLSRRIDAHEKIVLGALVKKAGLDVHRIQQHPNNAKTVFNRYSIDDDSATYDRELILGALLWLASALKRPDTDVVFTSNYDQLRQHGREAGANRIDHPH